MVRLVILGLIIFALAFWTYKKPRQSSAIVWALLATLILSAGLLKLAPGAFGDTVLWYAVTMPLLWASAIIWVYWEKKAWRVPAGLFAMMAVGGVLVYALPSPV